MVDEIMKHCDVNKDGKISMGEVKKSINREIKMMKRHMMKEAMKHMKAADTNNDNAVDRAELVAYITKMMKEHEK